MHKIQVLDCTLRDGGYCNQWKFGQVNIQRIISALAESSIDVIECGFLTNKGNNDPDITKFDDIRLFSSFIPEERNNQLYVCMMNYGEFDVLELPEYDGTSVDGIRVAFHKANALNALKDCEIIKRKGYKVFVQAMVALRYSDEEYLKLIHRVNEIEPYAFYIVDSFGMMKSKDLTRMFYMVEHNLKEEIVIGFHSHNNMQLAYSNAQSLSDIHTKRKLIIDASIYGMGRGAGNLNTELFLEYLNDNKDGNYQLEPLLSVIDLIIRNFYHKNYWGYSLPNYLSASHGVHPNYAGYLDDKKTLPVEDMDRIFQRIEGKKRFEFDKKYIEDIYVEYMAKEEVKEEHKADLKACLNGKNVLLIAPGRSIEDEKENIFTFLRSNDVVVVSVNFEHENLPTDYIFVSNLRRFRELDKEKRKKILATSNIESDDVYLQVRYRELLNDIEPVKDNAGLMAIKLLIEYKAKGAYLAGFDGYSGDIENNYVDSSMTIDTKSTVLGQKNRGMTEALNKMRKEIHIEFITTPKYVMLQDEKVNC